MDENGVTSEQINNLSVPRAIHISEILRAAKADAWDEAQEATELYRDMLEDGVEPPYPHNPYHRGTHD